MLSRTSELLEVMEYWNDGRIDQHTSDDGHGTRSRHFLDAGKVK